MDSKSVETDVEFLQGKGIVIPETENSPRMYQCNLCSFQTAFRASLMNHQAVHSDVRPWLCDICDYAAKRKHDLKKHLQLKHKLTHYDSYLMASNTGSQGPNVAQPFSDQNAGGQICSQDGGPVVTSSAGVVTTSNTDSVSGVGMNDFPGIVAVPEMIVANRFVGNNPNFLSRGEISPQTEFISPGDMSMRLSYTEVKCEDTSTHSSDADIICLNESVASPTRMPRTNASSANKSQGHAQGRSYKGSNSYSVVLSERGGMLQKTSPARQMSGSWSSPDIQYQDSDRGFSPDCPQDRVQRQKRSCDGAFGSEVEDESPRFKITRQISSNHDNPSSASNLSDHSTHVEVSSSVTEDRSCETKKSFTCPHCDILFFDNALHLMHMGLHGVDDPWNCGICNQTFSEKYSFTSHFINQH